MTAEHGWDLNLGMRNSVGLVRRVLRVNGLHIVEELELSAASADTPGCVVLLVDSPELLFEAIALDRAAAVLVPLHVVVTGDGHRSRVHWTNPLAFSGLHAPASARVAIERLCARLKQALSRALDSAVSAVH